MTRTVRYLSRIVWQYLFTILGVAGVLIAFQALVTPFAEYEHAAGRITGAAFSMALLFPTLLQLSMIPIYLPLGLSMGVTRRGFFWGAQVAKLHTALGVAAIFELVQIAAQTIFGAPALFYGDSLISVCMVILLSAAVGDTLGFVGMRFGRKGLVTMCVLMGVLSGGAGGMLGYLMMGGRADGLLEGMMNVLTNMRTVCAVTLVAAVALTAGNALLCRSVSVK